MATAHISHIAEEEENFLRIHVLLNIISPNAVRVLFNKQFHPTCLYATIKKKLNELKDLRLKNLINSSQWSLLFPSNGVPDSKSFDVTLMITLIRNLVSLPAPASGYGKLPLSTDTTPSDDLTRIEYYKNKLAHFKDGQMGSAYFTTAWDDMSGAIGRLGGPDMVAECEELRTRRLYHSTEHLEKRITRIVVDDDSETIERYSRVSRVSFDTFLNILRDIIRSIIPARLLYQTCVTYLNHLSNSYSSMDISMIYMLLIQFCLIHPPTQGWRSIQDKVDIKLEDDVERIRRCRNQYASQCSTNIGRDEFEDNFDKLRKIYEREIVAHKTCTTDRQVQTNYMNALTEIENIKLRFERRPRNIFLGDSFDRSLSNLRSVIKDEKEKGKPKVRIQIFQKEEEVATTIDIFNSLKEEISKDIGGIALTVAVKDVKLKIYRDHEDINKADEPETRFLEQMETLQKEKCRNQFSDQRQVDGIYKVQFSFGLELIIDRRLEKEYRKLIQTNSSDTEVKHEDTYRYMVEFLNICELRKQTVTTTLPTNHLIDAIQREKELRVRWLLSNFDFENLIGDVFLDTLEVNDTKMTKTFAWVITNKFFKQYKQNLSLVKFRIWPGFRCICHQKDASLICSKQFEIIIESLQIAEDIPNEFAGFKVRQLPYEKDNNEARKVTDCLSKHWNSEVCCDNISIPGKEAESLFDNHSNLTLICSSIIRSAGMPCNHTIKEVRCIQLHCWVKGVIPVGEDHFPSFVCNYPTDVLEGCPLLATGITVGEKVGTVDSTGNFKSRGTLGGFIKHLGYPCFLTCAHVVFDLETLLGRVPNDIDSKGIDVFTSKSHTNVPICCGRVIRRVFEHSDKDKTSIDAALVNIIRSISVDPQKIIVDHFGLSRSMAQLGISSIYLNEICVDIASICHSKAELLCPGGFLKIKDKVKVTPPMDYVDIQFPLGGSPVHQGYAQPLMIATSAHMQLSTGSLAGQRVFRMYNQLLLNLPLNLGDSGTCIYVIDSNKQRGCLGMAIGFLSSGQCIITPLKEILKKLKH